MIIESDIVIALLRTKTGNCIMYKLAIYNCIVPMATWGHKRPEILDKLRKDKYRPYGNLGT